MSTIEMDLSTVPGAMERVLTRQLTDGLIEFEEAPVGFLKKDGEPRKAPWRAYHWTPAGGKRTRLPSTTRLLDCVCPKPGLPPWAEARGIEGTLEAVRRGLVTADTPDDEVVGVVRREKLGADQVKLEAAERGLNVHALLEEYMLTGTAPTLAEHPDAHHGYITALSRWLLDRDPEPVAVEQLVVHPEDGYAGRLDLRARIGGLLTTVDAKTQENGGIYRGAHLQVAMYERAAVRGGDDPADRRIVVVFAANGDYREMAADHEDWRLDAALAFYRACKPIDSCCESANRAAKKLRETT